MNPVKILLVDDDEDDFILTKDILRESANTHDYLLSWCNNFSDAINAMLKGHYDVYLVDYRLGRDSGIELLNEAIKSNCSEPIIILTGKGDLKIDQDAMRRGAADYLVKDTLTGQTLERSIRYAIEQNRTFQQLKNSEKKFRIIFERSKDPMLITNSDGQVIDANQAATKYFESTLTDLQKGNAAELYRYPKDRLAFVTAMNESGCVSDLDLELKTRTGKIKFCSISSFLQVAQHANEELYYSILHDLTYRLQQEKDLALGDKLEATERIARNLSDEILDPLSNVNLALDELSDSLSNEEHLLLLDIIKTNCQHINKLTSELIDSTASSALELSDFDVVVSLLELVDETKQDFGTHIYHEFPEGPLMIKADEKRLKLAIKNIIQNAVEAMDSETGRISVLVEKKALSIKILVADNGAGIKPENIAKVFEPFYSTKSKAAGLGLTRTQRIISAHNGKIHIVSELGNGTRVNIILPSESIN